MSAALNEPGISPIGAIPSTGESNAGPLFRLSVERYLEAIRRGVFNDEDQVELIEGVLVAKMGKNPLHVFVCKRLFALLAAALPAGWHASKEDPFRGPDSVPEPDCAVLRGRDSDYLDRLPSAADVALVVEISESSLARDRGWKLRAFARAGIPTYWLVNLIDRRVEVYSNPSGPTEPPSYGMLRTLGQDDDLAIVLDGVEVGRVPVRDFLPGPSNA